MTIRFLRGLMVLSLASAAPIARADEPDRLERALRTVRDRVYLLESTPENKMIVYGNMAAGLGTMVAVIAGVGVVAVKPPYYRWVYPLIGVPTALAAGGLASTWRGHWRKTHRPTPPPPVRQFSHYQSLEGLKEFGLLSTENQRRLAEENPDFAAFLIEIAEAYDTAVGSRFDPRITP